MLTISDPEGDLSAMLRERLNAALTRFYSEARAEFVRRFGDVPIPEWLRLRMDLKHDGDKIILTGAWYIDNPEPAEEATE